MALAFCLVLVFAGNANAGPSPYYFDVYNNAYVEVASLGSIFGSEWQVLAMVDLSGSPPDVGLGFSLYNRGRQELGLHICATGAWLSNSREGTWLGSGSEFAHAVSSGHHSISPLYTAPMSAVSSGDDPSEQ